ncbi:MAG: hypothetical protein ACRD0W_04645 [Acidimicrobiales bacterium]
MHDITPGENEDRGPDRVPTTTHMLGGSEENPGRSRQCEYREEASDSRVPVKTFSAGGVDIVFGGLRGGDRFTDNPASRSCRQG